MKAKSKNNPEAIKPSLFVLDEVGHLKTNLDNHWKLVPKDLSDALTKETLTKLGIKK